MSEPNTWRPNSNVIRSKERMVSYLRKSQRYEEDEKREQHLKELAHENKEKYGNNKYVKEGMMARIFGEYLLDISLDKLSKADLQSFKYGYYEASNRQISLMCSNNIITDFVQKSIEKLTAAKKEELENLSIDQLLFDIGYHDAKDSNINIDDIDQIIKNNSNYTEGYITGVEETKKSGRGRK